MNGFRNIFTTTAQRDAELGFTRMLFAQMSGEDVPEYVKWVWMLEVKAQSHHGGRYHGCFAVENRSTETDNAIDWVDNVAVRVRGADGRYTLSRPYIATSKAVDRATGHITWVCFEVNTGPWADLLNSETDGITEATS